MYRITPKTSRKAVSLGFPFKNNVYQAQLQIWLAEVHDIHVEVNIYYNYARFEHNKYFETFISHKGNDYDGLTENLFKRVGAEEEDVLKDLYFTREEALEQGLFKGLNILENDKKN